MKIRYIIKEQKNNNSTRVIIVDSVAKLDTASHFLRKVINETWLEARGACVNEKIMGSSPIRITIRQYASG